MNKLLKVLLTVISILVLILSFVIVKEVEFNVSVIELPKEANAKCLDGSNYRFQLIKGFGKGQDKFLLSFEGGGWCGSEAKAPSSTIEACRKRALTPMGTKASSFSFTLSRFQRLFSNKPQYNPEFYNWNKVVIKYCDGFGHQSNADNYGLYFRGLNNTLGVIKYLEDHLSFKQAESVIVTGYSAGGLAAITWSNYIDSITTKPNNTYSIIDSGLFYNIPSKEGFYPMEVVMKGLSRYSGNNTLLLNSYCKLKDEDEQYKCFLPDHILSEVKVPMLIIQNVYDLATIGSTSHYNCMFNKNFFDNCTPKEKEEIKKIGINFQIKMKQLVKENKNITAWLPKLLGHSFIVFSSSFDSDLLSIQGVKIMDMINNWYRDTHNNKKSKYTNTIFVDENDDKIPLYKDSVYYGITYNLFTIPGM